MTEARIKVFNGDVVEFNTPLSHFPDQRETSLTMFETPVTVTHGKHPDDPIELFQGKHHKKIKPGELTRFRLERKTIEVAHLGEVIKFK